MPTSQFHELPALFRRHIEILTQRYERALERCGADRALLFAGTPIMRERDDQAYPFRSDPYFQQWLPLPDAAGSVIEIRPGQHPHLLFAVETDFWHAPPELPQQFMLENFEVSMTTRADAAKRVATSRAATVAVAPGGCAAGIDLHRIDSEEFLHVLDFARGVKTEYEIACIAQANRAAAAGHAAVAAAFGEGSSEFDLYMVYAAAAGQSDHDLPYPSIVALNEHAAILHYQHHRRTPPTPVRSLLIDAGAQYAGYAADVTRTWSRGDASFAELIERIDELQQYVCAQVTEGVDFVALNALTHELLAGVLEEFDLVTCEAATALEHGATAVFLPHGLGHLLGLQVHDVGGQSADESGARQPPPHAHPYLRLTRALKADMVLTIEPGIYFIEQLIEEFERRTPGMLKRATVDRFAPYGGVRIEDNVRVKSRGHENLTRSAFAA